MKLKFVDDYINSKLQQNDEFVRFTFYELRVKNNLTEEETNEFLELAKNRFENMNYRVYFTNDVYNYNNQEMIVQINELMVAIKN